MKVPHPDVFWNDLTGMIAQKKVLKIFVSFLSELMKQKQNFFQDMNMTPKVIEYKNIWACSYNFDFFHDCDALNTLKLRNSVPRKPLDIALPS